MKVLIVGRGAREHALGWKLSQSQFPPELFFAPGNSATALLGKNLDLDPSLLTLLADWASCEKIDLTVVGPENPLMMGIQEEFTRRGLLIFGPSQKGARLEGSKIWTKDFLLKYGIPTAAARPFDHPQEALKYAAPRQFPLVIKADGLAEGKGVAVCLNAREVEKNLAEFMTKKSLGKAGERVLVEDFLQGEELSAFALCDGKRFCYFGEARDYKRAYEGDRGPNTGGMGAVSDPSLIPPSVRQEICEKIFKPTVEGLFAEKISYQGVLFAGLMLTKEGPKVLEYNVRFGDPETQVLLPRMKGNFLALLKKCAEGNLADEHVDLAPESTVGVVIAANGYPGKVEKGTQLPDLQNVPNDLLLFYSSTSAADGKIVNQGGRTLTLVARGGSVEAAREKVYSYAERQTWGNYFYRKDIGLGLTPAKARIQ